MDTATYDLSKRNPQCSYRTVKKSRKKDWIEVAVDGVEFLSAMRVLRRMYPGGIPDARLTVDDGILELDFPNGGSRIPCKSRYVIVAQIPGSTIRKIAVAHGAKYKPDGEITLVFRPKLQIFAAPQAGGPANIAAAFAKGQKDSTITNSPGPEPRW